jgi:nucleotide-binding universal stress UspA family protein
MVLHERLEIRMSYVFDRVLVAIDGSEASHNVLAHAVALARINDSEVIVYHVRQKAYSGASTISVGPAEVISAQEAASELKGAGIRARALEEDAHWGHTADSIIDTANRESAKVIVIGSRGLSRLPALLLGSVAYKLLHLSTLPVLVIPQRIED